MTEYSPYTPPTANTDRGEPKVSKTPLKLLTAIAIFSYLSGIGDGLLQLSRYYLVYHIGSGVIFIILGVVWYQADADKLGRPRSRGMIIVIVLFLALSIPVYLFRSRGAAKGAIATILFILFFVGCGILNNLGKMTVLGIESL